MHSNLSTAQAMPRPMTWLAFSLEEAPAEAMVKWLCRKLCHMGQKTLWEVVIAWGLLSHFSNVVTACEQKKHPHQPPQDMGGLQWGHATNLLAGQLH